MAEQEGQSLADRFVHFYKFVAVENKSIALSHFMLEGIS